MKRGEIRWYTFRVPDKRRPILILTRNEVIDRLNEIIVAPVTRTIRGLSTEVVLTTVLRQKLKAVTVSGTNQLKVTPVESQ